MCCLELKGMGVKTVATKRCARRCSRVPTPTWQSMMPPAYDMRYPPSEDGMFLSATAMQWQALQKEGATSVRSILQAVLQDEPTGSAFRAHQPDPS